ncbi:MAG: Zn-ribbon domain-containing OB-fold protein [Peptococcaceae bacterium]|nr:Zn-ribbon domain-containing OB-fold protein [Peptococcaceae bacterium]
MSFYKLTHRDYFEALKEGRLMGLKCRECGAYTAPPKVCCDGCGGTGVETVQLSGKGVIKTFTVIRVAPEGLEAPYIVAMAELEEGPWIMGNILDVDPDKAGMDLIGKKVAVDHKVLPPLNYTSGEGVAPVFKIIS